MLTFGMCNHVHLLKLHRLLSTLITAPTGGVGEHVNHEFKAFISHVYKQHSALRPPAVPRGSRSSPPACTCINGGWTGKHSLHVLASATSLRMCRLVELTHISCTNIALVSMQTFSNKHLTELQPMLTRMS